MKKNRLYPVLAIPVAALLWLLLLDFSKVPLTPNPESSWAAVLTEAAANDWRFGREIIFTYGPLAPLVVGTYSGKLFTGIFVGELLAKGFAVALLAWLARRLPAGRALALGVVVLIVGVLSWQAFYLLALAGVGLVLAGRERRDGWWTWPALGFTVAISLTKAGFLCYAALMLAAVTLERAIMRDGWRRVLAPGVGFAGLFAESWLLLHQRLGDLPGFLRGTLEITGGYTQAMSVPPTGTALTFGLLLVALTGGRALVWARRGALRWVGVPRFLMLAGSLFIAWKLGFARADNHVIEWFLYAALATAAMPLFFDPGQRGAGHWVALGAAVVLAAMGAGFQDPGIGRTLAGRLAARGQANLSALQRPRELAAAERAGVTQQRRAFALPRIRDKVGRGTVDVMGIEQASAILNGMNYRPRPVFEGYSAYTPALVRVNGDFFRSPSAPEFVLFRHQPLDNRVPTLEDGPVLMTLARGYEPALAEEGHLLLRRRADAGDLPPPGAFPTVASGEIAPGESLNLPETGDGLWCELELRETLAGKLLGFVYQQSPVELETVFERSGAVRHRLVPGMARGGFLVSPQPASEGEFLRFQGGGEGAHLEPARSIRVVDSPGLRWIFRSRIAYRIARVPGPFVGAAGLAREVGPQLFRYGDVFPVDQPSAIHSVGPVERVEVEGHPFLLVHAPGEMEFSIPPGARRVSGQFVIRPEAWQTGTTDGVEFRIEQVMAGTTEGKPLFTRTLDPVVQPGDRAVQTFDLELLEDAPGGRLLFRTLPGPAGNGSWDWSCWSAIRFDAP